ncbi:hypothetical protein GCM10009850_097010 [Nonomuraea monospora]|uniref:Uncharacterized protein n=1 Tax=Nonomuraea monospora TaxID=568818 RepID=A0ABN3CXL4_9ACTN
MVTSNEVTAPRLSPIFADPELCPGHAREEREVRSGTTRSGWKTVWAEPTAGTTLWNGSRRRLR